MHSTKQIQFESMIPTLFGVVVLLGGYPDFINFFVLFMGISLIVWSIESIRVSIHSLVIAFLLLVCSSLAFFLPTFDELIWRIELTENNIPLGSKSNPQFWISIEYYCWALFILSIGFILKTKLIELDPKLLIHRSMIVLVILSLILTLGFFCDWNYYFANDSQVFSFFHSRNQSALLMVFGASISLDYAARYLKEYSYIKSFFLFLAGIIISTTIIHYPPRAGIFLLSISLVFLFFRHTKSYGLVKQFFLLGLLTLSFTSLLIIVDSNTWHRILETIGEPTGFRYKIYESTFELIKDHPLGIGWGNFVHVFPQYWGEGFFDTEFTHPESSILWMLSEGGWLFGIIVLFLFTVYLYKQCRSSLSMEQSLLSFLFLLFTIHSVIDISAHRWGTLCWGFLFLISSKPLAKKHEKGLFLLSRTQLSLIFLGISIVSFYGITKLSLDSKRRSFLDLTGIQDQAFFMKELNRSKSLFPLEPLWYFYEGQLLAFKNENLKAKKSFQQMEFLRPYDYNLRWDEILFWADKDPNHALRRVVPLLSEGQIITDDVFRRAIQLFNKYPSISAQLGKYLLQNNDTFIFYLQFANQDCFSYFINSFFHSEEQVQTLNKEIREIFINKLVTSKIDSNLSNWKEDIIFSLGSTSNKADFLIRENRLEEASHLYLEETPSARKPFSEKEDVNDLSSSLQQLYDFQKAIEGGKPVTTLLKKIQRMNDTIKSHPYVYYWQAALLTKEMNYQEALQSWQSYDSLTK